jgi:hypothetical protein
MDADDLLAAPSPWLRPALPPKFWASVDGFRVGFVCADKVGKPERPLKMGFSRNPVSLVSEFRSFSGGIWSADLQSPFAPWSPS